MTEGMTPAKATALRKPFPKESIGRLPKGGAMLDYVGHAAVTDRLLTIDPYWSWEPFALDELGLPAVKNGNLWIKLTICGVTRPGVGDGKSLKEAIGDAIRNAAMRFGVALDLWAKEDLVEFAQAANAPRQEERPAERPAPTERPAETGEVITSKTRGQMFALFAQKGVSEDQQLPGINHICGTTYTSRADLLESDAKKVIAALKKRPDAAPESEAS